MTQDNHHESYPYNIVYHRLSQDSGTGHDNRMKKELTKELIGDLHFAAGKTWCERIPIFLNIFLSAFQGKFY